MLTPTDLLEKQFKSGLGYDKREVELFLHDISSDLNVLQEENADLKKKLKDLNESISYYKSIERTLQKALMLAEKTAQDTRTTALREADAIEKEAKMKASHILADSKRLNEVLEHKTMNLMQQYDFFKIHYENLLHAQLELLSSKSFLINTDDFSYKDSETVLHENENLTAEALHKSMEAVAEDSTDQFHFDFLEDQLEEKSYHTEDGFEFFTMKDE